MLRMADHRPGWTYDPAGYCCDRRGVHRVWKRNYLRVALVLIGLGALLTLALAHAPDVLGEPEGVVEPCLVMRCESR